MMGATNMGFLTQKLSAGACDLAPNPGSGTKELCPQRRLPRPQVSTCTTKLVVVVPEATSHAQDTLLTSHPPGCSCPSALAKTRTSGWPQSKPGTVLLAKAALGRRA